MAPGTRGISTFELFWAFGAPCISPPGRSDASAAPPRTWLPCSKKRLRVRLSPSSSSGDRIGGFMDSRLAYGLLGKYFVQIHELVRQHCPAC